MSFEPIEISDLFLARSLPSLPTVALDVLRICEDPSSDIGDLAEGLSRDPILAGRVLQMANSAYYNGGAEVTSLNRAAVMLGLRALKVLALGFTLANELPSRGESGGFDLQLFWHRSLVNAVAGRSVAAAIRSTKTEEAFLCGLLAQIGKLALAKAAPERYSVAVELRRRLAVRGGRAEGDRPHEQRGRRAHARPMARPAFDHPRRDLRPPSDGHPGGRPARVA